jgi:hypothetical protein
MSGELKPHKVRGGKIIYSERLPVVAVFRWKTGKTYPYMSNRQATRLARQRARWLVLHEAA